MYIYIERERAGIGIHGGVDVLAHREARVAGVLIPHDLPTTSTSACQLQPV